MKAGHDYSRLPGHKSNNYSKDFVAPLEAEPVNGKASFDKTSDLSRYHGYDQYWDPDSVIDVSIFVLGFWAEFKGDASVA